MTRIAALSTALALALLLAGCGEKPEPGPAGAGPSQEFTVVLDYFPNADHAGIFMAEAAGEFDRAGLDVDLVTPPDPAAPLRLLQAGRADLVITYPPELLSARDKGSQLLSVGALVQKPLTSLISLPDGGVRRPEDLRGKTVGTAGIPYQAAYLRTVLDRARVPPDTVRQVDVGFNLTPAMISGRVDATLGSFWNYEGVDLRRRGRDPVILRMDRLGVPSYPELVFAARRTQLTPDNASRIRRFLQAVARGTRQAVEDPGAAADALLQANEELDRGLQVAVIEATAPVFLPEDRDRPFGWQDEGEWFRYGRWMRENGLVQGNPRAEEAFTNEFLPGQGLAPNAEGPPTE